MRTMDPGYPKPITIWKGIPDSPRGAFVDKANGKNWQQLWFWLTNSQLSVSLQIQKHHVDNFFSFSFAGNFTAEIAIANER